MGPSIDNNALYTTKIPIESPDSMYECVLSDRMKASLKDSGRARCYVCSTACVDCWRYLIGRFLSAAALWKLMWPPRYMTTFDKKYSSGSFKLLIDSVEIRKNACWIGGDSNGENIVYCDLKFLSISFWGYSQSWELHHMFGCNTKWNVAEKFFFFNADLEAVTFSWGYKGNLRPLNGIALFVSKHVLRAFVWHSFYRKLAVTFRAFTY